jgi:hypothetical protein
MKSPHFLPLLLTVLALAVPVYAELLYEESFPEIRFPVNEDGLKNYGGFGPNESSNAASSQANLVPGGLTYVDSAGNALATSGKHAWVDTAEESATISHAHTLATRWTAPNVGDTIWLSFIGRQTAGTSARFFNLSLRINPPPSGTTPFEAVVFGMPSVTPPDPGKQFWRIWDRGSSDPSSSFAMSEVPAQTQVFLLARLESNVNASVLERYAMWLNPRLDQAPDESAAKGFTSTVSNVTSWSDISEIRLGAGYTNANGPASSFVVDEIRVGTTWRDVTPYLALNATSVQLGANGAATISWTAAPGAEDTVQWSTNLLDWEPYLASTRVNPTGSEIATWTTPPSTRTSLYLRVARKAPPLP